MRYFLYAAQRYALAKDNSKTVNRPKLVNAPVYPGSFWFMCSGRAEQVQTRRLPQASHPKKVRPNTNILPIRASLAVDSTHKVDIPLFITRYRDFHNTFIHVVILKPKCSAHRRVQLVRAGGVRQL